MFSKQFQAFYIFDVSHIFTFSNECYKAIGFNLFENSENLTQTQIRVNRICIWNLPRILHWVSIDVLLDHFQVDLPFNRPFSKGWTATKQQVLSFPTSYCSWRVKSIFLLLSGTNKCWSPTLSTKLQCATSASSSSSSSSTSPSYQWTNITTVCDKNKPFTFISYSTYISIVASEVSRFRSVQVYLCS